MNRKWIIILLLLLSAAGSNLYCSEGSNIDAYINEYLNNNPITGTVSTNKLDTTPIAYQLTLKTMPQHIPAPASIALISTTSLTTPAGDLQKKIKCFSCSFCSKTFKQSSEKKRHEHTHTGEKPYQCSKCPKRFKQSGARIIHERTHTGIKPYLCSHCPKAFAHSSDKKRHERIHTGETPYQCSHCSKRFKQSSHKKEHECIHHRGNYVKKNQKSTINE